MYRRRPVIAIVREELNRVGGQEVQLPIMQDQALWERSGRWEVYQASRHAHHHRPSRHHLWSGAHREEAVTTTSTPP